MSIWRRLTGQPDLPAGFGGELAADERVLAAASTPDGALLATTLGLWLPGTGRVGWHLVSKASWTGSMLVVVVAQESGTAGEAVLLVDRPPRRLALPQPGRVPEVVHRRVTASIVARYHRELPGGGAWFVQRRVSGVDGTILQVRPDPGTDDHAVRAVAAQAATKLRDAAQRH